MWKNDTHTKSARKAKFINILRQFQDLNNYASKMNRTFGVILLVQPLISSFSMILSLFCVMVNFWYAGIGYIIFAYTQLLSMCAVGQSVQNNNGHLLKVLSETEWILFSIEEQKLFVNALRAQQRAPDFWIGPFVPYNMETASKVSETGNVNLVTLFTLFLGNAENLFIRNDANENNKIKNDLVHICFFCSA
ncbi:uncharacterized protein LOC116340516 [Contarinia nasturtii]|uniref:uncharacterized protein LOC116340516 n=1 Tax=Contarinia nasturtii TaxID=265458 RepID=UPI0012D3B970|nr:uncharacterized protein LOC116340516 [Contarinia nasturtii]